MYGLYQVPYTVTAHEWRLESVLSVLQTQSQCKELDKVIH